MSENQSATQAEKIASIIKKTHILIVEDEEVFRNAMVYEFARQGFIVSSVENGKKAMEVLKGPVVHVVISDIRMPGGDGIELLEHIKKNNPTLPIVMMMTGFAEISSEEAQSKGAEALFSKPFDRKVLVESVKRLIINYNKELNIFASSVRTSLNMKCSFNHKAEFFEQQVINLSPKGVFITMENDFPQISDEVSFELQIDTDEWWVGGRGLVKWVTFKSHQGVPAGVGIEFSNISDKNKQKIAEIIKIAHDAISQTP